MEVIKKSMTLLEMYVTVSIIFVLLGNIIYSLILVQRRFLKASIYIKSDNTEPYENDLQRIIRKVNGWLYLLIFLTVFTIPLAPGQSFSLCYVFLHRQLESRPYLAFVLCLQLPLHPLCYSQTQQKNIM